MSNPEFLTRADAAVLLKCDVDTIDSAIKRGELRAIKIGRCVRIEAASIASLAIMPVQSAEVAG